MSLFQIEKRIDMSENNKVSKENEYNTVLQDNSMIDSGPFYHGTRADLKPRDLLEPGYSSNYGERKRF